MLSIIGDQASEWKIDYPGSSIFESGILDLYDEVMRLRFENKALKKITMDITGSSCPYTASAILDYIKEHGKL